MHLHTRRCSADFVRLLNSVALYGGSIRGRRQNTLRIMVLVAHQGSQHEAVPRKRTASSEPHCTMTQAAYSLDVLPEGLSLRTKPCRHWYVLYGTLFHRREHIFLACFLLLSTLKRFKPRLISTVYGSGDAHGTYPHLAHWHDLLAEFAEGCVTNRQDDRETMRSRSIYGYYCCRST